MSEQINRDVCAELWQVLRTMHDDEAARRASAAHHSALAESEDDEAAHLRRMQDLGWDALRSLATATDPSPCTASAAQHVLRFARERYQTKLRNEADEAAERR